MRFRAQSVSVVPRAPNVQVLSSYFLSRRRTIPSTWSTAPYVVVIILSTWCAKSGRKSKKRAGEHMREERTKSALGAWSGATARRTITSRTTKRWASIHTRLKERSPKRIGGRRWSGIRTSTRTNLKTSAKSPQKCSFASTKPSKPSAVDDSRNVKNICILQTVYETLEKFQPTLKIFIHLLIRRFRHCVAKINVACLQLRLLRTESVPLILTGRDVRTL